MTMLLSVLWHAAAVALTAAVVVAWWWETSGRREWQRELNRRDAERVREWRRRGRPLG